MSFHGRGRCGVGELIRKTLRFGGAAPLIAGICGSLAFQFAGPYRSDPADGPNSQQ